MRADDSPSRLTLASSSPRRLALLRQVGVEPDRVVSPDVDEAPLKAEPPRAYAARVAQAKALAAKQAFGLQGFVLAADTTVALGRRILSKAEGEDEAARFLALLSGRRHRVLGAVCLITPEGTVRRRLVTTSVSFKRLSKLEVDRYLASGEWRGKAGGYAIQGLAAAFVPKINGSYANVVGLPVVEALNLLEGAGWRRG